MAKVKVRAEILSQECLCGDIYSMWLKVPQIASQSAPGQFVDLYSRDGSRLLPRPISLCEIRRAEGRLRLVYRVAGAGTKEFSQMKAGDWLEVLGPLGNGFPMDEAEGKGAFLIGGGIGIPPMLELAKELAGRYGREHVTAVLGYRDSQLFLKEEFEPFAKVYVATEDGSIGTKGNVLDAIRAEGLTAKVLYACGPTPMRRPLKAYGGETGIPCWISLEEKMACGIGACLACVCQSKDVDGHSHVHNKRICKDGPVFLADEIEL